MEFSYEDMAFSEDEDGLDVSFLNIFGFKLDRKDIEALGYERCSNHAIFFKTNPKQRWVALLEKGFRGLKNRLTGKPAVYIHKNSGIPLIGHVGFGIVDRNTNLIEVKPITGCNLNCIYCSVDAGQRPVDFVVEKDYLVEELRRLVSQKSCDDIEVHIGAQGEPLLYKDLALLIRDVSAIPEVKRISMDTNGTLLSHERIDELLEAGLTRFNLSINSLSQDVAGGIAGAPYSVEHIRDLCSHIISKNRNALIITPVWIPGVNDSDIEGVIKFAKGLNAPVGIQNFLNYRHGKNPVKQLCFEDFYKRLAELEKRYDIKLVYSREDFGIARTKRLLCPFRKNKVIEAEIICNGRLRNEGLAVAKDRVISVPGCPGKGKIRLLIARTKHNIIVGKILN